MDKKLFIIGDVHGKYYELLELLSNINVNDTRVIFVGDIIDRGNHGRKIINLIRTNKFECVLGNHELMFIDNEENILSLIKLKNSNLPNEELEEKEKLILNKIKDSNWYKKVGGEDFFSEYETDYNEMMEDLLFLKSFPVFIETNAYDKMNRMCLVSHTCLIPFLNQIQLKDLKMSKAELTFPKFKLDDIPFNFTKYFNIFGHTPIENFYQYSNTPTLPFVDSNIGIANVDTGACYDKDTRGFLSGIFFPSLEIFRVKSNFPNT